jgi:hypothetical protein
LDELAIKFIKDPATREKVKAEAAAAAKEVGSR